MSSLGWRSVRVLALSSLSLLLACSGGSPTVEGEGEVTDTTPPVAITDLMTLNVTSQSATLQWTSPADHRDDGSDGGVVAYDLRMSDATITEGNFAQAQAVGNVPAPLPAGRIQSMALSGLAPGSSHRFALKSRDDRGNWSGISGCADVDCLPLTVVSFPDPNLEQAIRDHLRKPTGELHSSDVDTILHFTAVEAGIVDLSGLQSCLSLQTAQLRGNDIADLEPLRYMHNLGGLYLNSNQVSNLGPLVGLTGLRQLHLIWNPVTDLLPVAYLRSLQQLTLSGTEFADYSPLYGLEFLDDLYLGGMNLVNIDFVARLTSLRNLSLEINHIYSAEALRALVKLESVSLMQNEIVDIGPLAGLVNLRELNLAKNRIADLQALLDNTGLGAGDHVDVRENPLSASALGVQIPALEARGVVVQH